MSEPPPETLKNRLERRPLLLTEALDLAAQIAAALAAAHERGSVHGALEPAKVRIYPVERVEVVGWDGGHGDPRSDIRALGVILGEMLAGRDVPPAVSRIAERALARDPAERYGQIEEMLADLQAVETSLLAEEDPTWHPAGPPGAVPFVLTGRRISHFQVAELLGGGGMGVVYRAEDTRLGRPVALKFLAPELGRDPIAKARFLTEARTGLGPGAHQSLHDPRRGGDRGGIALPGHASVRGGEPGPPARPWPLGRPGGPRCRHSGRAGARQGASTGDRPP